ncbi:MAG: DUF4116 domain-containing protein [Alcanivorax sp.]
MRVSKVFNNSEQMPLLIKSLAFDAGSPHALGENIRPHLEQAKAFFEPAGAGGDADLTKTEFAMPVFEAFASKTDPTYTVSDQGRGAGRHIDWITKIYAQRAAEDKPIKSEDLYKISDELKYFDKAKAAIKDAGKSTNLNAYENYGDFTAVVIPMMLRHQDKLQRGKGMPDEVRDETTILYDGPEGKVVMPHTVRASQFWGQGTTWCISERASEDEYWDENGEETEPDPNDPDHAFHTYNNKSPVIIYAPKRKTLKADDVISGKVAVVDNEIYNEQDDSIDELPAYILQLREAALNAADSNAAHDYLETYGNIQQRNFVPSVKAEPTITHHFENLPPEQQDALNRVQLEELSVYDSFKTQTQMWQNPEFVKAMITVDAKAVDVFSDHMKENINFAKAAVALNGLSLQYLGHRAKRNGDVVMTALEQNGLAMQSATAEFKEDPKYVLAAVRQNAQALRYAAPEMSKDLDIALTVVESDPKNMKMIDPSLFENREFVATAIEIARDADEEGRQAIIAQLHRAPDLWGHVTGDLDEMAEVMHDTNAANPYAEITSEQELQSLAAPE